MLLMKCPVCKTDGVPIRRDPRDGDKGYHMFHAARNVSCSIGRDDDGAESIRARLDELDRVAAAIAGEEARTGEISVTCDPDADGSTSVVKCINSDEQYEATQQYHEANDTSFHWWEGDGGFSPSYKD
jgi:hypothetical protein